MCISWSCIMSYVYTRKLNEFLRFKSQSSLLFARQLHMKSVIHVGFFFRWRMTNVYNNARYHEHKDNSATFSLDTAVSTCHAYIKKGAFAHSLLLFTTSKPVPPNINHIKSTAACMLAGSQGYWKLAKWTLCETTNENGLVCAALKFNVEKKIISLYTIPVAVVCIKSLNFTFAQWCLV